VNYTKLCQTGRTAIIGNFKRKKMDQRVVRYIRLAPLSELALAISLPIALISIAKLLVVLAGIVVAYLYLTDSKTSNKI
jgi:hypothetical protein